MTATTWLVRLRLSGGQHVPVGAYADRELANVARALLESLGAERYDVVAEAECYPDGRPPLARGAPPGRIDGVYRLARLLVRRCVEEGQDPHALIDEARVDLIDRALDVLAERAAGTDREPKPRTGVGSGLLTERGIE